jgi:Flp pilus assembly protein TadG
MRINPMRLLRSRRGTVAMSFAVMAIPMLSLVGLATEGGMWYTVKRHTQNAADAAAYSGALRVANPDVQTVAYRGKEFASKNGFCNTGDTGYPGSTCAELAAGFRQTVTITQGSYAARTFTAGAGTAVQAVVAQIQPSFFQIGNIGPQLTISSTAVAVVNTVANPCVLALTGTLSFQGSPTINTPGCGLSTNDAASGAINFTGNNGINIANAGSLSAVGGCAGATALCSQVVAYSSPVADPLAALATAMAGLILPNCSGTTPTAYTAATKCANNNLTLAGNTTLTLTGTYFISGTLTMKGTTSLVSGAGGATIIMLPGATFSMKGSGTITIAGPSTAPSVLPTKLLSPACPTCASLLQQMAIFDMDSSAVTLGGNSNLNFFGDMYFPQAAVTFQGNPVVSNCGSLIAASIAFNGDATLNNTGCPTNTIPASQTVALVQ